MTTKEFGSRKGVLVEQLVTATSRHWFPVVPGKLVMESVIDWERWMDERGLSNAQRQILKTLAMEQFSIWRRSYKTKLLYDTYRLDFVFPDRMEGTLARLFVDEEVPSVVVPNTKNPFVRIEFLPETRTLQFVMLPIWNKVWLQWLWPFMTKLTHSATNPQKAEEEIRCCVGEITMRNLERDEKVHANRRRNAIFLPIVLETDAVEVRYAEAIIQPPYTKADVLGNRIKRAIVETVWQMSQQLPGIAFPTEDDVVPMSVAMQQ